MGKKMSNLLNKQIVKLMASKNNPKQNDGKDKDIEWFNTGSVGTSACHIPFC